MKLGGRTTMKVRTYGRHFKEGSKNLVRNGWMTFASISAVTVMLLVVGAFLAVIMNINHFADSLEEDVEIRVFIDRDAETSEQDNLEENIDTLSGVDTIDYIPRDEGLEDFIDSLGDEGDYFESLREENPLNDVFVVNAENPEQTDRLAADIEGMDHVENLEYGQDIFEQLFSATDFIRIAGIVLIAGLLFTAIFLIANTIKLTIIARKTEIGIMKLVGATNSFIRWPFFIEGLLLGILGSILPIAALTYGYDQLYHAIGERTGLDFFEFLPPYPMLLQISVLLVVTGAVVGVWGSLMSVRKFLKV